MSTSLVDFHCHLDLYTDFENAVIEAERLGIYTLAVTTTPRAWSRNKQLMDGLKFVRPALGLHPQLVGANSVDELRIWKQLLKESKYIGEVGLDASPDFYHTFEEQKRVFEQILRSCAEAGQKVLSVHAIRSADVVLDMIEELLPHDRAKVVLHWFTGNSRQAERAISLGCYFSVNIAMLRSKRSQLVLRVIPRDRLLTETDGPFVKDGHTSLYPKDIVRTVESLGKLYHLPTQVMRAEIARNFENLLTT